MLVSNGQGLIIKVDLPALKRENLELTIDGNRLEISGHRPGEDHISDCDYLVTEIPFGRFERLVEIPAGYDLSAASAAYQNGVLRVAVPRHGSGRAGLPDPSSSDPGTFVSDR